MKYLDYIESIGVTDEEVAEFMKNLPEPDTTSTGSIYPIFSKIQGIGLASTESFKEGDAVLVLLKSKVRQVGARYINHSDKPNAKAIILGGDLVAIAIVPIEAGEEITMCYKNNQLKAKDYHEC